MLYLCMRELNSRPRLFLSACSAYAKPSIPHTRGTPRTQSRCLFYCQQRTRILCRARRAVVRPLRHTQKCTCTSRIRRAYCLPHSLLLSLLIPPFSPQVYHQNSALSTLIFTFPPFATKKQVVSPLCPVITCFYACTGFCDFLRCFTPVYRSTIFSRSSLLTNLMYDKHFVQYATVFTLIL